jgi:hypothetical protein
MASRILERKWILLSAATLISTLVITAGVFSTRRLRSQQAEQQPRVNYMPPFFSKVKQMEIVRASLWISDRAVEPVGVEIEIKNNSKKDVVAVDLVCGEGSITHNGLTDEEHPVVVMGPNETTTIRMDFSEMTFGAPLVVSAVTYADGTEEGDEKSLRRIHLAREHDRAVIKAQKERDTQKGGVGKP